MAENDFGAQYQPCSVGTFLDFDSDYHPHLYGDMVITRGGANPRNTLGLYVSRFFCSRVSAKKSGNMGV